MQKDTQRQELVKAAMTARKSAYCPYSGIAVGAALLTADGKIYTGANIENAAYSPSVCAERVAVFSAVLDGAGDFTAIAVCGGKKGKSPSGRFPPCGVCRQVLREFCKPNFEVLLVTDNEHYEKRVLADLLPDSFGPEYVEDK